MLDPQGAGFSAWARVVASTGVFVLALCVPLGVSGQDPVQIEGRTLTETDVLSRIQQSGLTRAEAKDRLSSLGYDPLMADAYFDRIDGTGPPTVPNLTFLSALAEMGLVDDAEIDGAAAVDGRVPEALPAEQPSYASGLQVFGRSVFAGGTSQFQAISMGPVDAGYRLGPGDQLQLVITGDVELAYALDVSREGLVVIPDVGEVSVNGLTLGDLNDQLFIRLGRVYSGVRRSDDATTRFSVSLGRLRSNQVVMVGEVTAPGAYQVSASSTVFNALYAAGGPSQIGSMRSLQVRRAGEIVVEVDVYDYLLTGDTSSDIRLEQGDLVFVPFAGPLVSVVGAVRRQAVYELKSGERLGDLLAFAGGPRTDAYLERVQIDRILPPEQRTPSRERMLIDVDLVNTEDADDFVLLDGDRVSVVPIGEQRGNRVTLRGHVIKPGVFELTSGMSLDDLIQRGGGIAPDAFEVVVHLIRVEPLDGTASLERIALGLDGRPARDMALLAADQVIVYGRSELQNPSQVSILGEVKNPGSFPLAAGMTAQDLVLVAGGFTALADPNIAELSRLSDGVEFSDVLATTTEIMFGRDLPSSLDRFEGNPAPSTARSDAESAAALPLRDGDRIFVRRLQGMRGGGLVGVEGEVMFPGSYPLELRDTRVSSLVNRAGDLTPAASIQGARLRRGGLLVGIDLAAALANPGGPDDVLVQAGDALVVPIYDATVAVTGSVEFETRARWVEGMGLSYYLNQAGGVTAEGNRGGAIVTYANGERDRSGRVLWLFRNDPAVRPGSVVTVPAKVETAGGGFNVDAWMTRTVSLLTILVAFQAVSK